MLTARQAQASLHESLHFAQIVWLGLEVVHVERKSIGTRHGAVGWRAGTGRENQAVYLAPLVGMIDSVGFTLGSHGFDIVEAKKIGDDLMPAIILVREAQRDPRYKAMVHACWNKLNSRTELTSDDIEEVRNV